MNIDLNMVMKLEDVQTKPIDSVPGYINELEYAISIFQHHIRRCKTYMEQGGECDFGTLDAFLNKMGDKQ